MVTHAIWWLMYLRGARAVSGDSCDMVVVVPARSSCGDSCDIAVVVSARSSCGEW